jgi:5-formyltetrahydrofolate cyclo-ligase
MTDRPRIPRTSAPLPAPGADKPAGPAVEDKAALRRQLLALRAGLDPAQTMQWDADIGAQLLAWWRAQAVGSIDAIGVYWPLRGEPDLSAAYLELRRLGVQLALPLVQQRAAPLAFCAWEPGEAMEKDAMGVAVPVARRLLAMPPAIVVPCLGFNAQGMRLGYGGGFYDRTLAQLPRPRTVGVAYGCLSAPFAGAAHDIALDLILTETLKP